MAHLRNFSRVLDRLNVSATSPVAVAVSGGCDSLALTLLAKKVFNRVIGITVDHRLREGSGDEAVRVGELIRRLGVEHRTVDLDWGPGGTPREGKVQLLAREKRLTALLDTCKEMDIRTLLLGHHLDDQNETFIMRLALGSGVDGLGCIYPCIYWPGYPSTAIVRPLLEWRKTEVMEVCRSEGVEWVEDPTNASTDYMRNRIRLKLSDHPQVSGGLPQLIKSCSDARDIIRKQVKEATLSLPTCDERLGCVSVDMTLLKSLPQFVATRVLVILACYVTGSNVSPHYRSLRAIFNQLPLSKPCSFGGNCTLVPLRDNTLCIVRGQPSKAFQTSTPIEVGQPLLWDNRWLITLTPRRRHQGGSQAPTQRQFKVRHLRQTDWGHARLGLRRVRKLRLPHEKIRGGFPVITDDRDKVVAIPHFNMYIGAYQIDCSIEFCPQFKLEELLKNYPGLEV